MSALTLLEQLDRPSILDLAGEARVDLPEEDAGSVARSGARATEDTLRRVEARFGSGGLTLDELLVSAWEGVAASRTVPCPVCSAAMMPRFGSGPGPVAARCSGCATELD